MSASLLTHFQNTKRQGDGYQAKCPAHEDRVQSLTISPGEQGKTVLYCHAGCDTQDILNAVGLKMTDLFPDTKPTHPRADANVYYDYLDENGELVYQVVRKPGKKFSQRRPDPDNPGKWVWNLKGITPVLYQLPKLISTDKTRVFLVEGEKDVQTLAQLGLLATTTSGGAGKRWRKSYNKYLERFTVFILPDNDEPGRKRAREIRQQLPGSVIVELPGLPEHGDVTDWVNMGGDKETLIALAQNAPRAEGKTTIELWTHESFAEHISSFSDTQNFKHTQAFGWMSYDKGIWERSEKKVKQYIFEAICRILRTRLAGLIKDGMGDSPEFKDLKRFTKDAESAQGTKGILTQLSVFCDGDHIEFDGSENLLCLNNGVIDTKTGNFSPHSPEHYFTKKAPVTYNPDALCPMWDSFLHNIFEGDKSLIDYFQFACGYGATGSTSLDLFFLCIGPPASGKSTAFEVLQKVLGEDYAHSINPDTVLQQKFSGHSTDLASLRGARMGVIQEIDEGRSLNTALIKSLSGGDSMRARLVRQDSFQFKPAITLFFASNHAPKFKDSSGAINRRARVIPFKNDIPKEKRDPYLVDTLSKEAPGILNWLLEGATKSWNVEPAIPKAIQEESDLYTYANNPLERWFNECCELNPSAFNPTAKFYNSLNTYLEGEGESFSKTELSQFLATMGGTHHRGRDGRGIRGIALRS